jgi:hypothetical protein
VDAFVGGGTTLIEAWLLRRHSVGIDISRMALQTTRAKLSEMEEVSATCEVAETLDPNYRPKVIAADALSLTSLLEKSGVHRGTVKLVCAHPPYLDSVPYTLDNTSDLSRISDRSMFFKRMGQFARQVRTVLSPSGVCAVLIGDVRKNGKFLPLGFGTLNAFLVAGFELETLIVKTQHKERSSEFYQRSASDRLLMAHEYLLVLRPTAQYSSVGARNE